jgi:hypothetical protein
VIRFLFCKVFCFFYYARRSGGVSRLCGEKFAEASQEFYQFLVERSVSSVSCLEGSWLWICPLLDSGSPLGFGSVVFVEFVVCNLIDVFRCLVFLPFNTHFAARPPPPTPGFGNACFCCDLCDSDNPYVPDQGLSPLEYHRQPGGNCKLGLFRVRRKLGSLM